MAQPESATIFLHFDPQEPLPAVGDTVRHYPPDVTRIGGRGGPWTRTSAPEDVSSTLRALVLSSLHCTNIR